MGSLHINVCLENGVDKVTIKHELETYIHGIEIDDKLYNSTLINLDKTAKMYDITNVKWNIINSDTMDSHLFDGKMDYVIGNPPYCNVHDLGERYEKVKLYKFANGGMTDLFLVFFEIGINMLNEDGKLAYITPNSWLTSKAATNFRNYLLKNHTLLEIYQYGHKKVFDNINTYTCITILSKQHKTNNIFICQKYDDGNKLTQSIENLDECMINGNIYLTDGKTLNLLKDINKVNNKLRKNKNKLKVKNGFATLNDKLFVIDEYVEKYGLEDNIINVKKASNGEWHYFFYPYDNNGKSMEWNNISFKLSSYFYSKALKLKANTNNTKWYLYGRTQALNDVKYKKIVINNLIRNRDDIKIEIIDENVGIYSGFYIPLYDFYRENIEEYIIHSIKSDDFISYVMAVGKYKNGGYYTFSSRELEDWINYCVYKKIE